MTPFHTITTIDVTALRARCVGTVAVPGDAAYDQVRQAWNLAVDQRPPVVVVPTGVADVQAAVAFARANGLKVAAQGTGHNAGPLAASLRDAVLVKTHAMRDVWIDAPNRRVRVAAGVLWAEVTEPASEHGLAPLAGSSPDVGVVGYCLGGGASWLSRKHGLAANSVLAIEIVTADGALRRVDAEHDAGLFWALRGGGGNFGVVTAVELRLFEVPDLTAGMLVWPWERAAEVARAWREWTLTAPEEATTAMRLLQVPPLPEIPEIVRGRRLIVLDGAILAGTAEAAEILAPLRALEPEIDTFMPVAPVALSRIHMDPEEPMPGVGDGGVLAALPTEAIDAFVAAAGPGSGSQLLLAEIRHGGGAMARVPEGAGVAGAVAGPYLMYCGGPAFDGAMADGMKQHVANFTDAMAPWTADRTYMNFAEAPASPEAVFGAGALDRLLAVKSEVDPDDVFLGNHPITDD